MLIELKLSENPDAGTVARKQDIVFHPCHTYFAVSNMTLLILILLSMINDANNTGLCTAIGVTLFNTCRNTIVFVAFLIV